MLIQNSRNSHPIKPPSSVNNRGKNGAADLPVTQYQPNDGIGEDPSQSVSDDSSPDIAVRVPAAMGVALMNHSCKTPNPQGLGRASSAQPTQ